MNEELKIIISAEISKLQQGVQNAKEKIKSFQDQVKAASAEVDSKFKSMGTSIANGAKSLATGLAAGTTALLALGASTKEYRTEQAKLQTAFEAAGSTADQAKTTYNELQRVLGDSGVATEAANHLAKLTTNEKALSEWTNICQGIYATFGDSIPIEGLTEAANETAKVGTVTGTLADALNWAGISEDAFNEKLAACNTEAEREKLIRETLTGLYDEAAATYEKNSAEVIKQNEAQAKLQETTAALGEAVAPVVTAFTNFANEALAAVIPHIQSLSEKYMPELKALLEGVTEGLKGAFEWISEHKTLLGVIAGVIGGLVVSIGLYNAVAAVKAAMDAAQVTTLAGLAAAYLAQAAAMIVAIAPYALIVAAIAAVIAIIVLCVKHWDTIKAKVKEVWNNIKQWTEQTVNKVVSKFTELASKASQKVEELKQKAVEKFQSLKQSAVDKINSAKESVINGFNSMVSGAKEKLNNIANAVKDKFDSIKNSIKEKIDSAKNLVKDGLNAIKNFFTGAKWELPKIKLPHFSISGSFSLNPPSIPKISVSWYKLGGVFENPALFPYGNGSIGGLGEDGAEMVAPLENNLEWLDKLAGMLADRMGGNTPIVLNVDGKAFAQTAINTINQHTRQTGRLALNLV